jgi:hypothetical protein
MSVSVSATTVLLEDILVESPSLAATNAPGWSALSAQNSAYSTTTSLAVAMVSSPEASIAEQVFRIYEGLLGRAPDAAGMQAYVAQAESGLTGLQISDGTSSVSQSTWNGIVSEFMNSSEYAARFPVFTGAQATTLTVDNIYGQILHRAPSSSELAYYVNELSGGTSLNAVLQQFLNSPEFINDTKSQIDSSLIHAGVADVQAGTSATHTYSEIAFGHSTALIGVAHSAFL